VEPDPTMNIVDPLELVGGLRVCKLAVEEEL
jgi:hypothetical protein